MSFLLYQKVGFNPVFCHMSVRSTTRVGFVMCVLICVKGEWVDDCGLRSGSRSLSAVNHLARHWTAEGSESYRSISGPAIKPIYTHGAENTFQLLLYPYSSHDFLLLLLWFSAYTHPNAVPIIVNGDVHIYSKNILTQLFIMNLYLNVNKLIYVIKQYLYF